MKLLTILLLSSSLILSDEIARMESIVSDIQTLRTNYKQCQIELENKEQKIKSTQPKEKINLLEQKISQLETQLIKLKNNEKSNNDIEKAQLSKEYEQKIIELERKYKNDLENKNLTIQYLKNQINDCKPILKKESRICKEGNEFPELLMKEEYQPQENLTATPPVVYRLNKESKIYDAIGGSVLFQWEEKTSFTSVFETKNWVVISGYFVDKVWKRAEQNLWIEKYNITKR